MKTGTVKWFNAQKGYGFIQPDDGGPDVFVHIRAVERAGMPYLREGQKIVFDVVADKRTGKLSAENVRARGLLWEVLSLGDVPGLQALQHDVGGLGDAQA